MTKQRQSSARLAAGTVTPRNAASATSYVTGTASRGNLTDARRIEILERELQSLSLRLTITRSVARDMSTWVRDDEESVDLVIADVLRRWQDRDLCGQPAGPDDPEEFWNQYANRVEFAPPGSDDEYRAEFCPAGPEPISIDDYYLAVWQAHVAQLRAAAGGAATI
jgi:hypothetical protein